MRQPAPLKTAAVPSGLPCTDDQRRAASYQALPRRAVADAFTAAMKQYGIPAEVLTDNGKQFTGRFTKPYSPTTAGKIERWHQTLRREPLDVSGPFADLPSAQAAITAWVQAHNRACTRRWAWPPRPACPGQDRSWPSQSRSQLPKPQALRRR
jgi:transposase InsO family protein